jgi:membrane-associated phospholipid phosphatase
VGDAFALDHTVGAGYAESGPSLVLKEPGETFGGATLLLSGTAALAVGGVAFHKPVLVRTAKESALALGLTAVGASLVKVVTQRERPDASTHYSFPSGHTAGAFAVATVLDREFGRGLGRFAFAAAVTAGYARIANDRHYFSDVVAGMLVGNLVGRLVTRHRPAAVAAPEAVLPDSPPH